MATDRTEHTLSENDMADRENHENRQDENMYEAINRFLGTREQSYEEFINGFTQLTTGDVERYQQHTCTIPSAETNDDKDVTTSIRGSRPVWAFTEGSQDELEEEVLEDMPHTGTLTRPSGQPGQAMVKFDNFVDDEGESDDGNLLPNDLDLGDLLGDSSYSASFLDQGSRETTSLNTETGPLPDLPLFTAGKESKQCAMETNFGEVEDIQELNVLKEKQTCLELTSRVEKADSSNVPHMNKETGSDEVETFQLDPDFDYDSVKLTPKFSQEDLRLIYQTVTLEH